MQSSNETADIQSKILTYETINQKMKECRFDVRGELMLAANKRAEEGKEVIITNVGNPHAVGQQPIKFPRQVLSLMMAPFLLNNLQIRSLFPSDVIDRAQTYIANIPGGVGAYQHSKGNPYIRKEIANFITKQSTIPTNYKNIFITNGASECIRMMLATIIRDGQDGIMCPIPQYPLYSASIQLCGGQLIPYYLHEESDWSLDMTELQRACDEATRRGTRVRALIFTNPGNPTGHVLTQSNIRTLLDFCHRNRLVVLADEVYQENVYNPELPFISARKTLSIMGNPYLSSVELVSFHSISKGFLSECGLRSGYMELLNFDPRVIDELYKVASVNLCSNVPGQIVLGIMVNPPILGDPSYAEYQEQKTALIASMGRKARLITDTFNSLQGVSCQETDGAMYSFPKIELPTAFLQYAAAMNKNPDVLYCLQLLDQTGISCVPGSGFQQLPGTYHLRTTILPSEEQFQAIVQKFVKFHMEFMKRYGAKASSDPEK